MSMGDLSTFCSLLQSLSSLVCSFPCRVHSHPLLSLFLGIWFFFFEATVNGIVYLHSFSIFSLLICRKATDFCKLLLYLATLLKLFVISRSFGGLLDIRSCHLRMRIVWLLPYLSVFLLFLLPVLLLWLGITGLCWIGVGRVSTHVSGPLFLT
jgi:hypothetical protein